MNNERRQKLEDIWSDLESWVEEETEAVDNVPENLQSSEQYSRMEENRDSVEEAKDLIRDVLDG